MASRTPELSPEAIKRRKRQMLPRAPEVTLGERAKGLKKDEDELQKLLEKLLYLAERETLFTMTLERGRLFSALAYAGFVSSLYTILEVQQAPGTFSVNRLAVPAGSVYCPLRIKYYTSLPWWLEIDIRVDAPIPPSLIVFNRAPESHGIEFKGISAIRQYIDVITRNNHVANTLNCAVILDIYLMTITVWNMLEVIYLKPIAEYAQEQAEKLTGRPWP